MKKGIVGIFILTILATGTFSFSSSLVDVARVDASTNETNTVDKTTTNAQTNSEGQQKQRTAEQEQVANPTPNRRPTADAGTDKKVDEGSNVVLDATHSSDPDGDNLIYQWRQISGPRVTVENANSGSAAFAAPAVNRDTTLAFAVTVNDNKGGQDRDTLRVSVNQVDTNSGPSSSSTSTQQSQNNNNNTANALSNAQRNTNINNNNSNNSLSRIQSTLDAVTAENAELAATGSFTAQALSQTIAYPSNNIVNTRSWYGISFKVGTTATIARVDITFPAGTNIANAALTERSGVNAGSTLKSGQTISYVLATPQQINAGLVIRLEYNNILNPPTPNSALTVQVLTKDSGGGVIDSGTSVSYAIKQIGTGDIADNAITSAKIGLAEVGPNDIANNAVNTNCIPGLACLSKLADNAVINSKIANDAVTGNKIAPGAVGAIDIIDGSIGSADIGPDAVGTSQITTNGVGSPEIADGSVGAADIGANAVGTSEIADQSIGSVDIGANAVGASEIVGVDKLLFGVCNIDWPTIVNDDTSEFDCNFPGAAVGDLALVTQGRIIENIHILSAFINTDGSVRIIVESTANNGEINPFLTTYAIIVYHIG